MAKFRKSTKVSVATDLKRLSSNSSMPAFQGIQFGSPSNARAKPRSSAGSDNEWTNLLKAASGGVASLIGGGFLESGVNSLLSGLTSLFDDGGGSDTPPARFTLPDSQRQTMFVNSGELSASDQFRGVSKSTPLQGPVYKQSEIVQAVKNALLTSSSLNDVIAEI